jgi:hypothetical protein
MFNYLKRFVVWKVNDARALKEDLVRETCKLELSMMQTRKVTANGETAGLTHDMKAAQKTGSQTFGYLICNYQVVAVCRKKCIN